MMFREQRQFLVYPRRCNGIKFNYKGEYFFKFQVCYATETGVTSYGYPYIVKNPQKGFVSGLEARKKAYTKVENNEGTFYTRKFDVRFESQTETLNDMCIFNLQKKVKKERKGCFILTYELMKSTTTLINNPQNENKMQVEKSSRSISKKSIKIKDAIESISEFYRLDFMETDYFGWVDVYIATVWLGDRIRPSKYTLCQFVSMTGEQKKEATEQMERRKAEKIGARGLGKLLIELTLNRYNGLVDFYVKSKIRAHKQLIRITEISDNLPVASEIQTPSFTLQDPLLLTEMDIYQYYQTTDLKSLYFEIFRVLNEIKQETNLLQLNVRSTWKKLQRQLTYLDQDTFISFCQERTNQMMTMVDEMSVVKENNFHHVENRKQLVNAYSKKRKEFLKKELLVHQSFEKYPLFILGGSGNAERRVHRVNDVDLVVFIHGFHGTAFDLEKASNFLLKFKQNCEILVVKSIENSSQSSIDELAQLAANEINLHIKNLPIKISSISLIGFSLGGVVARAALSYLSVYKHKFNLLVSFSSPHLGTFASENSLVKAGIWFMIKFNKAPAIQELHTGKNMKSSNKSFMKILSESESINWFRKIILVSCVEDEFVPHYSSTIRAEQSDPELMEISMNIRNRVEGKIENLQIWFDLSESSGAIDKLTGRNAHIEFLDNSLFLDFFFRKYFEEF